MSSLVASVVLGTSLVLIPATLPPLDEPAPEPPTPEEVLTEADQARGNLGGVEWRLSMVTEDAGDEREMDMQVQSRGFDVLVTTLSPARSKGNKLLMLKDNMWFHRPGLSKPVPISKRQKLMGTAAYGDVATTNYAGDYDAQVLGEEVIDGTPCYVFDLTARHNKTTYDRIRYWVTKDEKTGVRAEYYTVSGKLFKSARMEYHNRVERNGEPRPFISRIRIQGELINKDVTELTFSSPTLRQIPDAVFNLNLMVN